MKTIAAMGTTTSSAATLVQIAQVYGGDSAYLSVINAVTSVLCVVTMPLFVFLFQTVPI